MQQTQPSVSLKNRADVDTSAALFDYRLIYLWMGFIFRSVKRHRFAAFFCFVLFAVLVALIVFIMPPKYHSETVLLANRNSMLASLGNPHRNMAPDTEGPTQAARETVMAHNNLVSMVRQLELVEHWQQTRNPILGLKDKLMGLFSKPPTEEEKIEGMVGILEKRLVVYTGQSGTVSIEVFWPEASLARRIVEAAQQNFLEARHLAEVSAISEAISILEGYVANDEVSIAQLVNNMEKAVEERRAARGRGRNTSSSSSEAKPSRAVPRPSTETANTQALAQLRYTIRSRARAIEDLQESRNRRVTELQVQLAEQRTVYAPSHPNITDLEHRIRSAKEDSSQLAALRREMDQALEEYRSLGGRDPETDSIATSSIRRSSVGRSSSASELLEQLLPDVDDDPSILVAREQLRMAIAKLQELQMRSDSARIEEDVARAAFKYRYSVVKPPQVPKKPASPNRPLIAVAGLVVGALLSVFICFLLDFLSGRIIEAWQIEQRLKLPVLSEFHS
ncbi:MAG: hypothetical protein FWC28_02090 [Proteobacteria bacterium]|nr:hypothetical protein [Cystobacterineae bacterium]MCL2259029.1 hypothetical protein [Cystobacterineae bacterium]MCL2314028.1 hypothetical protein [Pseudomonadota bacterium]